MANGKAQITLLEEVMNAFGSQVNGKPHTPAIRENIVNLVNRFTKPPYNFTVAHNKPERQINLWWETRADYKMVPDITIALSGKAPNETFWICDDGLVGTLQGLYEQIQEEAAYMSKPNR